MEDTYRCETCDEEFESEDELRRHRRRMGIVE
jgi:DNA-directed RNA polymerase subunit RPC12/RpoP